MANQFIDNLEKHNARTENNALAHSSTGSTLADQFSKAGNFRGRDIKEVFLDQSVLHADDPVKALRFVFYLRLITRKTKLYGTKTENVQRGQGQRDESFKRFLWYAANQPDIFYDNIWLFIPVGRYKDIFEILWYAHKNQIMVDEARVLKEMLEYYGTDENGDLLKKYIPLTDSSASTDRAKFMNHMARIMRNILSISDEGLRKFKVSGEAHEWQQKISQGKFGSINFKKIPGKALHNMVKSDFLANHDLEKKYLDWIKEQPVAKFTGYPYELMKSVEYNMPIYKKHTYDKQFQGLIELASEDEGAINGNVWCALDTSASMTWEDSKVEDGIYAIDVCLSLGIYFATLNQGAFHKHVVAFSNHSRVEELSGDFCDMVSQARGLGAGGSTNFQSVIDEIVRVRNTNPDVPLEDYPQTLLVISDMQFNPTYNGSGWSNRRRNGLLSTRDTETNHETAMRKLRGVFPNDWVDNFKVIWWDCTGRVTDNQPTHIDEGGTYVFSGWDGAIISLLLGGEEEVDENGEKRQLTLEEMIDKALSQEILTYANVE